MSRRMPLPPSGSGQAGLPLPPLAEVHHLAQPQVAVGELPLVDHHAGVRLAGEHDVEDAVEGDDLDGHLRLPEPQGEVSGGQLAGDHHLEPGQVGPAVGLAGDDDRPVAVAEARARGHDLVAVGEMGVGVEGEGRDLVRPLERRLVQALDVLQDVADLQPLDVEDPLRQGIEHEGIVRVGTVGDADGGRGGLRAHGPGGYQNRGRPRPRRGFKIVHSGGRFPRSLAGEKRQAFIYQRFFLMARPLY